MQIQTYTLEEIFDFCSGRYDKPCDELGSSSGGGIYIAA